MHPTRLHPLLDLAQWVCRERAIQVVGTTHDPAMLAFLGEEARAAALLAYKPEATSESRVVPIARLADVGRVLATNDLGTPRETGWLEDMGARAAADGGSRSAPPDRAPFYRGAMSISGSALLPVSGAISSGSQAAGDLFAVFE